jgi:alpha-L-fucosidase 2
LTDANFTWFSVNYRLAPTNPYPAAVDDVVTAVHWVKQHAEQFKADTKRLVLVGESAGGHLVALVGARDGGKLGLAGVVPYYAPCDLTVLLDKSVAQTNVAVKLAGAFLGITDWDENARRLLREASPVTHVTRNMPPFLLIHGNADALVPYSQSVVMRDRMKEAGAPVELYTVEGGAHGMNGWERDPAMQAHKAILVDWIKKVTH